MKKSLHIAAISIAAILVAAAPASAQVAGQSTSLGISITESTQIATGWSVKKTLLGKSVYNETGQKVGKVEDLIVAPGNNVSYVIVGAGGFVGIGRHDVAIPVSQIKDQKGKLVMAGATKDGIKALPAFNYADNSAGREQFMARAQDDIAKGKAQVVELEKRASTAAADAKVQIDIKVTELQGDVKNAEAKLAELQRASANRWHEFEASVNAATMRVRKSIERAVG
jgi:sporulation protein YlmC with PRC-barrel domain